MCVYKWNAGDGNVIENSDQQESWHSPGQRIGPAHNHY